MTILRGGVGDGLPCPYLVSRSVHDVLADDQRGQLKWFTPPTTAESRPQEVFHDPAWEGY